MCVGGEGQGVEHQGCIRAALDRLRPPGPNSARADPGSRMTAGPGQIRVSIRVQWQGPGAQSRLPLGAGHSPGRSGPEMEAGKAADEGVWLEARSVFRAMCISSCLGAEHVCSTKRLG